MISHTVIGTPKERPAEAVISAIVKTKKEFAKGSQVVHIIFASVIQTKYKWSCVVSIVAEPVRDDQFDEAIIFGHLPRKYEDLYDDILPEVDNLNLIEDDTVWNNIKYYLLDVYFYQAVHFQKLERITETGGGYFRETDKREDNELDEKLTLEFTKSKMALKSERDHLFSDSFYKAVETEEIRLYRDEEHRRRWRAQGNLRHQSKEFIQMLRNNK